MKKFYSFVLFALLSLSAFAEFDDNYYWFYEKAVADPTGKGKIYVSQDFVEDVTAIEYQDEMELKVCFQGYGAGSMWTYEEPADGYQLIGWFTKPSTEATMSDKVSDGGSVDVHTDVSSPSDAVENYPFEPNETFYAIFSKVKVQVASSMKKVGSVSISKLANNAGDQITITATPADETSAFAYWMDEMGNKITENPYTFTVEDMNTYTAYFSGESVMYIDFGEGKYIPFSNESSATLSEGISMYVVEEKAQVFWDEEDHYIQYDATQNAWGWYEEEYDDDWNLVNSTFHPYTGTIPELPTYGVSPSWNSEYMAGNGVILYGVGVQPIVFGENPSAYVSDMSKLTPTCTGAVNIADLPVKDDDENEMVYYIFNENAFVKATTGVVAKNECYLTLNATDTPLPEKIYIDENDDPSLAVEGVKAEKTPVLMGIYTINGQKVAAPVKGLNIIGGKKVLVK